LQALQLAATEAVCLAADCHHPAEGCETLRAWVNRFARTIFALSDLAMSSICVTRSAFSFERQVASTPAPRNYGAGSGRPWSSSLALQAACGARCRHGCRSRSPRRYLALRAAASAAVRP